MLYDEGLIEYLNLIGSEPSFIYNEDIRKFNSVFDKIFEDGIAAAKQIK